mgnify:CR=1 FL=1
MPKDLNAKEAHLEERLKKITELETEIKKREKAIKEKEKAKKQVLLRHSGMISPHGRKRISAPLTVR